MICSKCGKELPENARFCTSCGNAIDNDVTMKLDADNILIQKNLENMQQHMDYSTQSPNAINVASTQKTSAQMAVPAQLKKKKKKKGKKIVILVCILILLLVGGGCAFILYKMNLPVNKAENAFSSGDLDAALEYIEEIDNEDDLENVQKRAYAYAEEIKNNYINEVEGVDYVTASSALDRLYNEVLYDNEDILAMIELVDRINTSRVAFASAEKFKEAGRYSDAIAEYAKVIEEDMAYYQLAQQSMTDTIELYRTDSLNTAKVYEESGEYTLARDVLKDALVVLPNDSELISELNVVEAYIQEDLINTALEEINTAIDECRYEEAFELIDDALTDFPDNIEVLNAQATVEENYKEAKFDELEELYYLGAISDAIALLSEMTTYLPGDTDVSDLLVLYESYLPVSLSELAVYEFNYNYATYEINQNMMDTYENSYLGAIRFSGERTSAASAELIFLNNGNYNRMSGTLAYEYCNNTKGSAHLEIYADNLLVYASPTINDSTEPIYFEALLGDNCHKMKVVWISDTRFEQFNLILADAQVYNR